LQEFLNNTDDEVTMLPSSAVNMTDPIPLIPVGNKDLMLQFSYKEQGQRVDMATKDLLIIGQSLFSFIENTNYLPVYLAGYAKPPEMNSLFKTVNLTRQHYYRLKAKSSRNKKEEWLNIEHMGLVFQWFGRDPLSPVTSTYEIL
jgi:hypothetical protein